VRTLIVSLFLLRAKVTVERAPIAGGNNMVAATVLDEGDGMRYTKTQRKFTDN